jgi:hypothetical protein
VVIGVVMAMVMIASRAMGVVVCMGVSVPVLMRIGFDRRQRGTGLAIQQGRLETEAAHGLFDGAHRGLRHIQRQRQPFPRHRDIDIGDAGQMAERGGDGARAAGAIHAFDAEDERFRIAAA